MYVDIHKCRAWPFADFAPSLWATLSWPRTIGGIYQCTDYPHDGTSSGLWHSMIGCRRLKITPWRRTMSGQWTVIKVFRSFSTLFSPSVFATFSQQESIQARTQQITALSDAQLTSFPGSADNVSWWSEVFGAITSTTVVCLFMEGVMYWRTTPKVKPHGIIYRSWIWHLGDCASVRGWNCPKVLDVPRVMLGTSAMWITRMAEMDVTKQHLVTWWFLQTSTLRVAQIPGLITCTFYLNEDWDAEKDGGEIRLSLASFMRERVEVDWRHNFEKAFYSKYMFSLFGLPLVALLLSKRW